MSFQVIQLDQGDHGGRAGDYSSGLALSNRGEDCVRHGNLLFGWVSVFAGSAACALVLCLGLGACTVEAVPVELLELERLSYIPPGECRIAGSVSCDLEQALLVDRFEATRGLWRTWAVGAAREAIDFQGAPLDDKLPATFLTLAEARDFAGARGMRLPTASEWMHIASGTRAQPWPWGPGSSTSVANTLDLDLDLAAPMPVGTFERGCTPRGVYDLIGNVWEWVEGRIPFREVSSSNGQAWAMGGSYLSYQRPLFASGQGSRVYFLQRRHDPDYRSVDLGVRCVVEAGAYLAERAGRLGRGSGVRERLVAVGERFGPTAVALLSGLAEEATERYAAEALQALLEGARR